MKKLSILLTITLILSIFSPILLSEEAKDTNFEDLIILSKKALNISNEYDNISTEKSQENYSISWSYKDKDKNESEYINYNKDGYLIDYFRDLGERKLVKSVISKKDAQDLGLKALKVLYPERKYDFYLMDSYSNERSHTFRFGISFDKVPLYGAYINLAVSKSDARIERISTNEISILANYAKIKVKDIKLSPDQAYEEMLKRNPLYLMLENKLSSDDDKLYPYYEFLVTNPILDVESLELLDYVGDLRYGNKSMDKEEAVEESGLSPSEKSEIEKVDKLNSKEKAFEALSKFFDIKKPIMSNYRLYKNHNTQLYEYAFNYKLKKDSKLSIDGSIRAKDLFPTSFSRYNYDDYDKPAPKINAKKAIKILDKYEKKLKLDHEKLYEKVSNQSVYRAYYLKFKDYYLKSENYSLLADDKNLKNYNLNSNQSKDSPKNPAYLEKKIGQAKAEKDIQEKFAWQRYLLIEAENKDSEAYNPKIKAIKNVYAFKNATSPYDAITGRIFDPSETGPLFPPSGDTPRDLTDIVEVGFGVAGDKSFDDVMTFRDLMYNIYKLDHGYMENEDEILKFFQDLKVFDKKNLDQEIKGGDLFRAYYKSVFMLKDELAPKYFAKAEEDGVFLPYMQLARSMKLSDSDFKANDKIKVQDALRIISNILFK